MDDVWHIDQWGKIYKRYAVVARDLSFKNHTLSLGLHPRVWVFNNKSLEPWYTYYVNIADFPTSVTWEFSNQQGKTFEIYLKP